MVVGGKVSHELEVELPASRVWELYGTLELAKFVVKALPDVVSDTQVLQGHGEPGTLVKIIFAPGIPGPAWQTEKFTVLDDENRVKETELVEGGFLELGFTLYRVRFEIADKITSGPNSSSSPGGCVIKTCIEYELEEEAAANASFVSIDVFANLAQLAEKHLLQNKAAN